MTQSNQESGKDAGLISLGTTTIFGEVSAVGFIGGERYYWMVKRNGDVTMLPADCFERTHQAWSAGRLF